MRLSSMADYAVVTMSAAARHCGGARVSAAQLAEETGLPSATVQKLVSKLSAAGLLRSSRGAGGGLKLARPAAAISLADIVEAIGSDDGREIACALDELRQSWKLGRDRDGRYHLVSGKPGVTAIVGEMYHDPNSGT